MADISSQATNNYVDWNFSTKHVQQNATGSDYVGSHSVIICATYPRLSDMVDKGVKVKSREASDSLETGVGAENSGDATVYPIGLIDSSAVQQDRNVQQIFEIGSIRSYLLSARTITMLQLNRVMYNGPTMLRCLYAHYPTKQIEEYISESKDYAAGFQAPVLGGHESSFASGGVRPWSSAAPIDDAPGYNDFWMNLASDLFSHPLGIVMYVDDNSKHRVAAMYFEECYVQNHSFQMSANSVVMAESCTIRCDKMRPVNVDIHWNNHTN